MVIFMAICNNLLKMDVEECYKLIKRSLWLIIVDIFLIFFSYILSYFVRFAFTVEAQYIAILVQYTFIYAAIKVTFFYYFKLYKGLWKYASIEELVQVIVAVFFANTATVGIQVMTRTLLPRSIIVMTLMFDIFLIGGVRFVGRVTRRIKHRHAFRWDLKGDSNILVIGAGDAGVLISRELNHTQGFNGRIVGFVDDDPKKLGKCINGIPVIGTTEDIEYLVNRKRIHQIIIAIPSATKLRIKEVVKLCEPTGCPMKILPKVQDMMGDKDVFQTIREIQVDDLLGREEVLLDMTSISDYLEDKVIMVTGGGGSIGSELCRQIIEFAPKKLVLLDIYENNVYDLQNEIEQFVDLEVVIASVRDEKRIDTLIKDYRPDVIFHAAAHKHVPLMEFNSAEAVKNNVFGTYHVAHAAHKYGVKRVVLISTDKAVNPTNIMGATKRICEMIIQAYNSISSTEYVAVRFGNVLGSNGSVIPLFKKQIAKGGPVKVTHPDIIRYFMTIPEASRLVLQAAALAEGGEIFVLDMGEPVKILDLAKDMIRLSGYQPEKDIVIEFTGLRPGEKLYEELLMSDEGLINTRHNKIFIGRSLCRNYEELLEELKELHQAIELEDVALVREKVASMVSSYKPDNQAVNEEFLVRTSL
jgi:FlaA1/EpsC-like NDP-sugar epimerase